MADAEQTGLAQRIRERLAAVDLNPHSAALKADLKPGFVHDILRGKAKRPNAENLARLAEVLECSVNYLLGVEEPAQDPYTGERVELAAPLPQSEWNSADRVGYVPPRPFPVRFELLADHWRRASDVVRAPLARHAGSLAPGYFRREQWYELVRDQSMSRVAPHGSLVHVVHFEDNERAEIEDGDFIIVTRRAVAQDRSIHLIERSMRRVVERMPGVWFLGYFSHDERWPESTDETFRVADDLLSARDDPGRLAEWLPLTTWRRHEVVKRELGDNDATAALLKILDEHEETRLKLAGKVVRVVTPVDPGGYFGVDENELGPFPKIR